MMCVRFLCQSLVYVGWQFRCDLVDLCDSHSKRSESSDNRKLMDIGQLYGLSIVQMYK